MRTSELTAASYQPKPHLLALTRSDLAQWCRDSGEKAIHAKAVIKWVHRLGINDYQRMHDIKVSLRNKLAESLALDMPELVAVDCCDDGVRKYLFRLSQGHLIETVLIPERQRNTLCISTQVGCALNCAFCATAQQGFKRNLSCAEILSQLWCVNHKLRAADEPLVSNVVFMGMGEPLLNFDAVVQAASLITDDYAYGLAARRVTISTAGYVPSILRLQTIKTATLAISLHAPFDELRNRLVPLNRKYPIATLLAAARQFARSRKRRDQLSFSYVMLKGVNDSIVCAEALAALLKDLAAKVNLIPFNDFEGTQFRCSDPDTIAKFRQVLSQKNIITTIRRPRGETISAACGQLVGRLGYTHHEAGG